MFRFLSLFTLLLPALVSGAKYDGMFKLIEAEDEERRAVTIPSTTKPFEMVIRSQSESRYMISLRIGNSLRADMKVTNNNNSGGHDTVHFGDVMSTMMMPPENIFKLEQFLTANLPKMNEIYLTDQDDKLIVEGPTRLVFTRELTKE